MLEGEGPTADSGEEMALDVAFEVVGLDIGDRSIVNVAGGNEPFRNEVAEPLCGIGIVLVVVGDHQPTLPHHS